MSRRRSRKQRWFCSKRKTAQLHLLHRLYHMHFQRAVRLSDKASEGISSECLQGLEVMHIPPPLLGLPTPHGWKLMPGVLATAS